MDLLLVALLVLALGVVVAVAVGRVGGGLAPAADTLPPPLPEPVSDGADLDRARFRLALRGYRMDQVDVVLDQARDLLAAKDEEIARLRAQAAGSTGSTGSTDVAGGSPGTALPVEGRTA